MKKALVALCAAFLVVGGRGRALADNAGIMKEIQSLKESIEELEQKLEEQESLAKRQTAKTEKNIEEKIGEALEERLGTLEIHGGAILYYQNSRTNELDGAKSKYDNLFSTPFLGAQATVSPKFGETEGNYRFY